MNHVTGYLAKESRAEARIGEQADRDNRRGVVAYMAERGQVPRRWAGLRVSVEGEAFPHADYGERGECVRLVWASHGDRRFRWVARYSLKNWQALSAGRREWVERKRIEIPRWNAAPREDN